MCSYHFISILLVLMHEVYEVSDVAIARNYLIWGLFKQKSQWVHCTLFFCHTHTDIGEILAKL